MCQIVPCPREASQVWNAQSCEPSLVVKTLKRHMGSGVGNGGLNNMHVNARASYVKYNYCT